jgi:hypothetical protein
VTNRQALKNQENGLLAGVDSSPYFPITVWLLSPYDPSAIRSKITDSGFVNTKNMMRGYNEKRGSYTEIDRLFSPINTDCLIIVRAKRAFFLLPNKTWKNR